jgi:hypothetical protein
VWSITFPEPNHATQGAVVFLENKKNIARRYTNMMLLPFNSQEILPPLKFANAVSGDSKPFSWQMWS